MKNKFFLFLIPFVFAICLIPKNVFADTYSWSYQDSDFNLADKTKLVTTTCNNKGFSTSSLNCTNLSNNSFVIYNKKQDIYIVADNVSSSPTYSDYIPLASYSDSYGTHVGFLFNDFSVLSSDFSRVIGTSSATDKNYGVTWLNHYGLNFYEVYNSSYSTSSKINFPLVYSKLSMKTSNGISSTRDINHFAEVMFLNLRIITRIKTISFRTSIITRTIKKTTLSKGSINQSINFLTIKRNVSKCI